MKDPRKFSIEVIDQDQASRYLDTRKYQRRVHGFLVKEYRKELLEDRWKYTNASLGFAEGTSPRNPGYLIDGQHRLLGHIAVADELQKTVEISYLVVRGLHKSCIPALDIPRKRDGADALSTAGISYHKTTAAALQFINLIAGGYRVQSGARSLKPQQVLKAYKANRDITRSAAFVAELQCKPKPLRDSVAIGVHYWLSTRSVTQADAFMRTVMTGEDANRGSPELVLRNELLRLRDKTGRPIRQQHMGGLTVLAWNVKRGKMPFSGGKGRPTIKFNPNKDEFPEVL